MPLASKADKFFGYEKYKKFIKWFHRKYSKEMGKGKGQTVTKEEMDEAFEAWKEEGEPGPDSAWEDLLDLFGPTILNPCFINPQFCKGALPPIAVGRQ